MPAGRCGFQELDHPGARAGRGLLPQPSWILDAIDAKIVPLKGHVRTTNQTLGNKLKNERKGV